MSIDQYRTPEGEAHLQKLRKLARVVRKYRNLVRYWRRYCRIRELRA